MISDVDVSEEVDAYMRIYGGRCIYTRVAWACGKGGVSGWRRRVKQELHGDSVL